MQKKLKGPTWKKGQVSLPPVYHPPQEMADPEGHLSEEQKKWPRTELLIGPRNAESAPPTAQEHEPASAPPAPA